MSGKRDRELNSSTEEEPVASNKSRRVTQRSKACQIKPEETIDTTNMDERNEIKSAILEMVAEMRANTKEIRELREDMKKRDEKWQKEKEHLVSRIEKLENEMEKKEKEARRNNIIIKGAMSNRTEDGNTVREFLQSSLNLVPKIKKVIPLNKEKFKKITLVELESWNEKRAIMEKKRELKNSQREVYIENDWTPKERKVQYELAKIAKEKKNEGLSVKVAYRKLFIEGKTYEWNDKDEGVVETADTKNY